MHKRDIINIYMVDGSILTVNSMPLDEFITDINLALDLGLSFKRIERTDYDGKTDVNYINIKNIVRIAK